MAGELVAGALPLVAEDEVSEAADLDLLALTERLFHHLENEVDDVCRLLLREAADARVQSLDDLRFGHDRLVPPRKAMSPIVNGIFAVAPAETRLPFYAASSSTSSAADAGGMLSDATGDSEAALRRANCSLTTREAT